MGLRWKVSGHYGSQPVFLYSVCLYFKYCCRLCLRFFTCLMACSSVDDHCVVSVSRSSCRHGQRLPEPAVWFQGLLSLWRVKLPSNQLSENVTSPVYCTLSWEYRLLYLVSLKSVSGGNSKFAPIISIFSL